MMGNDENCVAWIRANRQETAVTNGNERPQRERRRKR